MCCKNNRRHVRHLAFLYSALMALLVAGPALAQAPIPLQPKIRAPAAPIPVQPEAPPPSDSIPDDAISVGTLGGPDLGNVGLLDETGGFGADMWRGTERALVERLLPQLPASLPSPTLQALYRRLLLSAADLPHGTGDGSSFLGMRLERLIAAGQFETAKQLAALAGEASTDEAVLQARAEIALADNELASACGIANRAIRMSNATYWLKLSGFCHVLNGNEEAAQLAAALAAEQAPDDTGYQNLLTALINKSGSLPEDLADPDILQVAMLRFASLPMPKTVSPEASPAVLKLLARLPGAPVQDRLAAAQRAEAAGAFSPEELAQFYGEMPFSVEERAKARDLAPKLKGGRANALMYQAARAQDNPAALASTLATAWQVARASDSFATVARVNLTPARDLVPAPELIDTTVDHGRALMAAGDPAAARRWYDMALASGGPGNSAATLLWPLVRLSLPPETMPEDSGALTAWLAQLPPDERARKGEILLSALSGLGLATPDAVWAELAATKAPVQSGALPSAAILHLLAEAAQNRRIGQTVLLSLICAGENATGLSQALVLEPVLRALNGAGLQREARALAVDAALRAGI